MLAPINRYMQYKIFPKFSVYFCPTEKRNSLLIIKIQHTVTKNKYHEPKTLWCLVDIQLVHSPKKETKCNYCIPHFKRIVDFFMFRSAKSNNNILKWFYRL